MATIVGDNLRARYAALQAERERDWSPAQLARNAAQRQQLVARFDAATVAQPGDVLPDLALDDVEGATLTLDALTAQGPALLIFFRFAGAAAQIAVATLWFAAYTAMPAAIRS